jgi:disulfide bond formation protein DsbB
MPSIRIIIGGIFMQTKTDRRRVRAAIGNAGFVEQLMYLSWAVSVIATLGSLYFSEVVGYPPCTYCWVQRILMYPLTIWLGMAAVRKDYGQSLYVLPISSLGIAMSTFHYLSQKTSWFEKAGASCGIIPCNIEYINWFGFVTIPFLALIAFILITVLQAIVFIGVRNARKTA